MRESDATLYDSRYFVAKVGDQALHASVVLLSSTPACLVQYIHSHVHEKHAYMHVEHIHVYVYACDI